MTTSALSLPEWNSPIARKTGQDTPASIRDTAQQFEALLIGQIMRSVRETSGGWFGCGEDQTGSSMSDYAEQQLAQVLSASGGLGLASLIGQGLSSKAHPQTLTDADSAKPDGRK